MTERGRAGRRIGGILVAVNAIVVIAKVAVWWLTGSLAVGSEAVNSLTDTVYSLVILAGIVVMTRPPDREHPHGHERIQPLDPLVVALGLHAAPGDRLYHALLALLPPAVTLLHDTTLVRHDQRPPWLLGCPRSPALALAP